MVDMEKGRIYKLSWLDEWMIVKVDDISTYKATGMETDYMFEYLDGYKEFHDKSSTLPINKDKKDDADWRFPIPQGLLDFFTIEEC